MPVLRDFLRVYGVKILRNVTYQTEVKTSLCTFSESYSHSKNIRRESHNALPNGIICLKGGDLHHELKPFKRVSEQWELSTYFEDDFFKTKKVAFVAM